jgi:hypothetical protein
MRRTVSRLLGQAFLLIAGTAVVAAQPSPQHSLSDEEMLARLPPGFECFARIDVAELAAWPRLPEVGKMLPDEHRELRAGGLWPGGELDAAWWALRVGAGGRGLDAAVLLAGDPDLARRRDWFRSPARSPWLRGPLRGPQVDVAQLAPRLTIAASPSVIGFARAAGKARASPALGAHERDLRARLAALTGRGLRLACRPGGLAAWLLDSPFLGIAFDTLTIEVRFGQGIELAGLVRCATPQLAGAFLANAQQLLAAFRQSLFAKIARLGPLLRPLELRQADASVEIRYEMTPELVQRALSAMRVLRDLADSSGDPVR